MIGRTLAHYEVLEKIGEGGMGEVYRARDTKLGREVALKVLPAVFARDADRMSRFEREARMLAQLHHPAIASIFGMERDGEVRFLVMELAEGQDLAARLVRGPLAVPEALELARQIAEGVEEAHSRGIVHRDLKPANIQISPRGRVKILDFGLAKAMVEEPPAAASLPDSPTITPDVTRAGIIIGTAAYMSPEQARGLPIDARTDVWAFGCVLFEMLTGAAPFAGATTSDVLAGILEREVDWSAVPEAVPPRIRLLLRRCLSKDADRRLHAMADARIELEDASAGDGDETPGSLPSRRPRWILPVLALGAFGLGLGATRLLPQQSAPGPPQAEAVHLSVQVPPEVPVVPIAQHSSVAVSGDGRFVVWVASTQADESLRKRVEQGAATTMLYMRYLADRQVIPLEGSEGATGPFISPDNRWIGYLDAPRGRLMKIPVGGGAPIRICDTANRGAAWSREGRIYFSSATSGILEVSEDGGEPRSLTAPDRAAGIKTHRFPSVLPDSRHVLFTRASAEIDSYDDADVALLSLETGEIRVLFPGGSYPRYAPTGHIVFARAGDLLAVPFDLSRLEVTGQPVRVLEGVVTADGWGSAQYSFSETGTLVYLAGGPDLYYFELLVLDPGGSVEPFPLSPRGFGEVDVSPDGRHVAISVLGANAGIWVHDLERRTTTRLTHSWDSYAPVWRPAGDSIAFNSNRGGREQIWVMAADGTGEPVLALAEEAFWSVSWSADGGLLAFARKDPEQGTDIWVSSRRDGTLEPVVTGRGQEFLGTFSPDGKYLAYVSDESGRGEVYAQPFPPTGRKWRLSENGGTYPTWSPDGSGLTFWEGNRLMVVDMGRRSSLDPGRARLLLETDLSDIQDYDVFPDGERFIVIGRRTDSVTGGMNVTAPGVGIFPGRGTRRVSPRTRDIQVVMNWFEAFGE